ncbi:PAS domain-containing protein [Telluribacter humicola]|uniref:PAS domain-containing protein n=1 Tax=Telluribacter humicola TaxID=1720261 RepID=UPI001A96FED2|nr:PAS domain-containing protein [Telluribacter humicola]
MSLGTSAASSWPDEWPQLKALLDQVLASGEATSSTDVVLPLWSDQPLPHQRWMFNYSPVYDEYGIATGVVVTFTELTQSTQINLTAESSQNVQAINQRYRMILDSLPANIAILDKKGEIISGNERWLSFSLGNNGAITGYIGANYLDV